MFVGMETLDKIRHARLLGRYWSLLIAVALPVLVFFFLDFESSRLIVSIISLVLLVDAWRTQMGRCQSTLRSVLWTSALLLLMLGAIWLGLNVIRAYTYNYAADYERHFGDYRQNLYWYVVKTQDWILWIALADLIAGLLLAVATVFQRKKIRTAQDFTT